MRLLTAAMVFLSACAGSPLVTDDPGDSDQRYEATATVLEDGEHGPELCLGGVQTSLPPQCGGPPITNWDWRRVEGETVRGNTTWGEYHVVGTYDGERFMLTEDPRVADPQQGGDPSEPPSIPCPTPPGGWSAPDPDRATEETQTATIQRAQREPDFAGVWIGRDDPTSRTNDPARIVLVIAFTGDVERHERELRGSWGGALCVPRYEHTERELGSIAREVGDEVAAELGFDALSWGVDTIKNRVSVEVIVVPDGAQDELDARYGPGTVVLTGRLRPIEND